jgi:hypothetical protein
VRGLTDVFVLLSRIYRPRRPRLRIKKYPTIRMTAMMRIQPITPIPKNASFPFSPGAANSSPTMVSPFFRRFSRLLPVFAAPNLLVGALPGGRCEGEAKASKGFPFHSGAVGLRPLLV